MELIEKKKILIADATEGLAEQVILRLGDAYCVKTCKNGMDAWAQLEKFRPDVLMLDLLLPEMDGFSLLKQIDQCPDRPKILLTSCILSNYIETMVSSCNIDMMMIKPCDADSMTEHLLELMEVQCVGNHQSKDEELSIESILLCVNISPKQRGTKYLITCAELLYKDPHKMLTKDLYPEVAKLYHTTPEAVERAIRLAIHRGWNSRNEAAWRKYLSYGPKGAIPRPTNMEMISRLAMILAEQEKKKNLG